MIVWNTRWRGTSEFWFKGEYDAGDDTCTHLIIDSTVEDQKSTHRLTTMKTLLALDRLGSGPGAPRFPGGSRRLEQ